MQADTPTPDPAQALPGLRALLEQNRFVEALAAVEPLLAADPAQRDLLYVRAVALRMLQRIPEALDALAELERWHPGYPRLHQERGHCHVFRRDAEPAIQAFGRAVQLNPALPASWKSLQSLYRMTGRTREAEIAGQHVATLAALPVEVVNARSMLADGLLREAEDTIRPFLERNPDHIDGMRVLASLAMKNEYPADAQLLLEAVLARAPEYHAARYDLVLALIDLHKHARAKLECERLIAAEPDNAAPRISLAGILLGLGETEQAVAHYRRLVEEFPQDPELRQSLGHALKALGRQPEAVEAYRDVTRLRVGFGEPWWSLANLKTFRFSDEEIDGMRALEARPAQQAADRYHLCFALGKALEDRAAYAESFAFYARGNALKKRETGYRAQPYENSARRQRELLTEAFFAERRGWGCQSAEPIFVLGLPRAGSTLLEQILASHPQVEGTMELANIPRLVGLLSRGAAPGSPGYPNVLSALTQEQCRRFGEDYLRGTLDYRSGRPFFVDKMPNNFRNIGLIHLILPNARIIDARRDAMDCCFSNFRQLYANGHYFAYSLEDIGHYYRTYVELMDHWDRVLPGRVLRVRHEDVIEDLEGSVRRILDHCGLPFDAACLEFHRTERTVHTASSEQVRRPINREGVGAWRPYAEWLGPLREALGAELLQSSGAT
jgi:tetratricopeptide (TPR) repeat protein